MRRIIGRLMFMANSEGVKQPWYSLKEKLCKKFGVNDGYDVQFIEGKKCYSCGGTGVYHKYYQREWIDDECYNCCGTGMYKDHRYIVLERIRVGGYIFHRPQKDTAISWTKPTLPEISATVTINGYIDHMRVKNGWMAFSVLFILFAPSAYFKYIKSWGLGWKCAWWLPKNYLHNIMHIRRNGLNAIPFRNFKKSKNQNIPHAFGDDLPF